MEEFNSIKLLSSKIKNVLNKNPNKKKVCLLYAFNSTGKTRLSREIKGEVEELNATLCFNAFTEDLFTWDNENFVFNIDKTSWIAKLIEDEGLDKDIITNFREIIEYRIEPDLNLENGEIKFNITTRR